MRDYQSLSHVKWECKYHIVWVPKYRRKVIYGKLRRRIGTIIRELCRQKGIEVIEGHAKNDHVHVCLSVPPKYSISHIVGFIKGKSAICICREFSQVRSGGKHFWIRGYFVSTVGLDEQKVRDYIRHQQLSDKQQLDLDFD